MNRSVLPTLRIGFVGAGFIAQFHLQALTGVRNATVADRRYSGINGYS